MNSAVVRSSIEVSMSIRKSHPLSDNTMYGHRGLNRRELLALSAVLLASSAGVPRLARAAKEQTDVHGLSAFCALKYPSDFKCFEYVNPAAPKGCTFSQVGASLQFNQNFVTFNSLNSYILRGDAALGIELTF